MQSDQKLYGSLEALQNTVTFITETGLSILMNEKKKQIRNTILKTPEKIKLCHQDGIALCLQNPSHWEWPLRLNWRRICYHQSKCFEKLCALFVASNILKSCARDFWRVRQGCLIMAFSIAFCKICFFVNVSWHANELSSSLSSFSSPSQFF